MCFGGGGGSPPDPKPVAPSPPQVLTTQQTEPVSTDETQEASNVKSKKKGVSLLTIPLTSTEGSGVQVNP